jgi:type II restriction/modification system DNA methylase subunit YeeA
MGMARESPQIGPEAVRGIEINPYAADLARMTVWIGEIQWMRRNGFDVSRNPILKPLDTIECRDAVLDSNEQEPQWPRADVVIGNPPFLGDKSMRDRLGLEYTRALRAAYVGRVPGGSDLICYWFEKARAAVEAGEISRVGLVATNAIRRGANRTVLDRIAESASIFDAWPDEEWTLEGAAVRVSLICFSARSENLSKFVSALPVANINSDLTFAGDLTKARPLAENAGVALQGPTKGGPFDIPGETARKWLLAPLNPNGRPNSDVLKPWFNGEAITERWSDKWIVDFGEMPEAQASLYESPFRHVVEHVRPVRMRVERERRKRLWWQYNEPAPGVRAAIAALARFIVAPETPTHNLFAWLPSGIAPDKNLIVIARDDDTTFGVLQSRFHLSWVRALGSPYGNHPTARRYNSSRVFRTYPFPEGLSPSRPAAFYATDARATAIAIAARRLDELRSNWLNPADLVLTVPEVVPGYPERLLPANDAATTTLKTRTLTNLYNERPAWLNSAHRDLDAAVAFAYGWPADVSNEDALARLLELNLARPAQEPRFSRDKRLTPERLRREPELPPMPITGSREKRQQQPLPLDEPLLSTPQPSRRRSRS